MADAEGGPAGETGVYVYAFATNDNDCMLCHLARTVEAAGGWLRVLGLRHGKSTKLPWGDSAVSSTREEGGFHHKDKTMMLKKHFFLARAIRSLPSNATVVFVDGYDTLFQRPLAEIAAEYRRLAEPIVSRSRGAMEWPVVFGGERNCWPFPHGASVRVPGRGLGARQPRRHEFQADSSLSGDHHSDWRYPCGDDSPWSIQAGAVCGEWLAERSDESTDAMFPFLCSGTYIGTASAVRRLLHRLFLLYRETREYNDQALLALLLLRNRSLGLVDATGSLFLQLHGHRAEDLERPLCGDGYWERAPSSERDVASKDAGGHASQMQPLPIPGYQPAPPMGDFRPPLVRHRGPRGLVTAAAPPAVLHFNGNGKRHLFRCIDAFRSRGLLAGQQRFDAECVFFDEDWQTWSPTRLLQPPSA